MVYLQTFSLPTREAEEDYLIIECAKNSLECYDTKYPFGIFGRKELPELIFDDITIFCGNNGSGKSTLLNIIAEKLQLNRSTLFNRSDFFGDYVGLCRYQLEKEIPDESVIVTSDGVFDRVLDIRRINDGIDDARQEMISEYVNLKDSTGEQTNNLRSIDDYNRWKKVKDAKSRNKTQSKFISSRLARNITESSNGESALAYFVDSIHDSTLCLLDEPENSLSAANQLMLMYFIIDAVKSRGCQFIISTHSPFLLSLRGALIYDLDRAPVGTCRWNELECVRVYYDFFKEHEREFR